MEPIEPEFAWSKDSLLDEELSPAAEEHPMSGFNFNETDTIGNESAYYEKFLPDEFDNYFDEVNDRLTVSRLVTNSVIKGMVNAVVEEAVEKVTSKEAEIASLKEKLRASSHNVVALDSLSPLVLVSDPLQVRFDCMTTKSSQGQHSLDKRGERVYSEFLGRIKIFIESQIQKLKDDINYVRSMNYHGAVYFGSPNKGECKFLPQTRTDEKMYLIGESVEYLRVMLAEIFDEVNDLVSSMKFSTMVQQWEHELHEEIKAVAIQNFVRDIQEECETKIFEQRKLINSLRTKYEQKVSEISLVREDLDTISKSLLNSDQILLSHTSCEGFDELTNTKWKDQFPLKTLGNNHSPSLSHLGENDVSMTQKPPETRNPMLEFTDYPHLKHMSTEELASYYKTEMTKLRRQHDKAMEEKTDELFRLKREFLKEKGSMFSKKDKELENVKNNIRKIILKLDDIQIDKEMLSVVKVDCDEFCSVKNKINSMFLENQRLQGLLIAKRKEVECLSTQVNDVASQMLLNTSLNNSLLEQIEKLKGCLEDLNLEVALKEKYDFIIWKEVIGNHKFQIEDAEMERNFVHDIYSVLLEGLTNDALSTINTIIMEKHTDQDSFESMLHEKELLLCSEIEACNKLKQEITSLSTLIKEKEKVACEACSTITLQKEHFDLVNQEISMLRDQVNDQGLIISRNKIQSDLLASQLDETQQQLHVCKLETNNLNHKLAVTSSSLEDSERQMTMLYGIIEEKEKKLSYSNVIGNNQLKQMEAMVHSWKELSEFSLDFESKTTGTIQRNESRLRILTDQCISLKQKVNLLLKKALWYKKMFDISNSNMQKAEAEVDLLGDEVDTLLSVLGKVYVALDHYSPVLQHYPGVMEILKLVRRELQGEKTPSR